MVRYPKVLGNVHFIDPGGWKPGGRFTFLELESLEAISGPVNSVPAEQEESVGDGAMRKDWGCTPAP